MRKTLPLLIVPLLLTACMDADKPEQAEGAAETTGAPAGPVEDPYLWLEEVEGEEALAWVEKQNEVSLGYLESKPLFPELKKRNLEILDSEERIAAPTLRGDQVFNFWQDAGNRRGIWRRATLSDYSHGGVDWEILLDLDALAAAEDEDWVWKGAECLRPDYRLCLVSLSRGGADATVVREFDTVGKRFVDGGFRLDEAKSTVSWVDENTLYVGTDFGEGSLTDSGYPRTSRLWRRGEPLAEAPEVFAGERKDVWAGVYRIHDHDTAYDIAMRVPSFFTSIRYLYGPGGELTKIEIPEDAELQGIVHGQMIVELKSAWRPAETEYPQGALLSIGLTAFLDGDREFQLLVEPTPTSAIVGGSGTGVLATRNFLVVNELDNVVSRLTRFEWGGDRWRGETVDTAGPGTITLVTATDSSDIFFYNYESFLIPDTLYLGRDGGAKGGAVRSLPAFFDTKGMRVEQHFAESADGTKVPYFVVLPDGFEADGKAATLMYGYGGFEVSRPPGYSPIVGNDWLGRGGVYVVANIRGGGEYGPRWHQAALKKNRQRAYDDFIAVAEDLIARNITSPGHLGIRGGSNGGLLTGVMLTQRPDLFNAVVVQVPLLDMRRFHKLLAGASWMGEYGDPDTDDWQFISKYSPYHNLDPDADYPRAFFTTSTRDDRVHPGHARKMVAKMQAMGHDLLYYENTVGGHAGASDNEQAARVEALIYTYLWDQLGDSGRD